MKIENIDTMKLKFQEANKAFAYMSAGRVFDYLGDVVESYNVKNTKLRNVVERVVPNMRVYNLVLDDYNYLKDKYPSQALFMSLKRFSNYCIDKFYEVKK